MAAIQAARESRRLRRPVSIVVVDGARTLGAKILVSGGGRCNVTHDVVDESAFAGSTKPAIRKVLRRFGVEDTVRFFDELGVALEREDTGKLFPVDDRARSVLDALLAACREEGVEVRHPFRVESIARSESGFVVAGPAGSIAADRVVLATGGRALPKSGSDGHGYELARRLGHTTTRIHPALVPLVLEDGCVLRDLPGVSAPAVVEVRSGTGRRLAVASGAVLCTHFGVSGPAVLDVSRHWIAASADDPEAHVVVGWLPGVDAGAFVAAWEAAGGGAAAFLRRRLPERLAAALCRAAGADPAAPVSRVAREGRRSLGEAVCAMRLPVTGDRGFTHAEVTAGGVPLAETRLDTLASRVCPGLHLAGEILDVDGRIGGFNFQWAWASGFVAGYGIARDDGGSPVGRAMSDR